MSGWRQAVFVRQRRIDLIQRALSKILDDESWSAAMPRRLYIGTADASSRGWTMIIPELANFFLDLGGAPAPRLCRLASELHCPAYEIDVRNAATTLFEVDSFGRLRITGSPAYAATADAPTTLGMAVASTTVGFGLIAIPDDLAARIATLQATQPAALADYLGAIAGFPGWTALCDEPISAANLVYEPPVARATPLSTAALSARLETHVAIARAAPRAAPSSHDRRGTRPRSAARPRR